MIVGSIKDMATIGLLSSRDALHRAFAWLAEHADRYPEGITELDGPRFYVNVHGYITRPRERCAWESHRRTWDLQVVISGAETIDWSLPSAALYP